MWTCPSSLCGDMALHIFKRMHQHLNAPKRNTPRRHECIHKCDESHHSFPMKGTHHLVPSLLPFLSPPALLSPSLPLRLQPCHSLPPIPPLPSRPACQLAASCAHVLKHHGGCGPVLLPHARLHAGGPTCCQASCNHQCVSCCRCEHSPANGEGTVQLTLTHP